MRIEITILAWTTVPSAEVLTETENCGMEAGLQKDHEFGVALRAWRVGLPQTVAFCRRWYRRSSEGPKGQRCLMIVVCGSTRRRPCTEVSACA